MAEYVFVQKLPDGLVFVEILKKEVCNFKIVKNKARIWPIKRGLQLENDKIFCFFFNKNG